LPRILVVEDDPRVQEVVSEFLRSAGHQVYCAASAEQARDFLARESIDLALIDCLMSGEHGDTLAQDASALGIATVLTSGDPRYLETFAESSVRFLSKPFRLSELEGLIARILKPSEIH
jgi:DNA-binding NtrC family response regulator